MFVKVVSWIEVKSKPKDGPQPKRKEKNLTYFIEDSTTYECKKYHKKWITRVTDGKTYMDLLLVMDDSASVTVEKKKMTEIYFMNNEGKTIDSIRWM